MEIYEELVARGLIAQVTDEDEIRDMINKVKVVSIAQVSNVLGDRKSVV